MKTIQDTIPTLSILWIILTDYEQGGDFLELAVKGA
jgi:hypothetical protein